MDWEDHLKVIVNFVTVAEHAYAVSHPEGGEVHGSVSLEPVGVAAHEVVVELVHVLVLPSEGLSIAVVPGAVSTSFLWPQVDHLSAEVGWVTGHRSEEE